MICFFLFRKININAFCLLIDKFLKSLFKAHKYSLIYIHVAFFSFWETYDNISSPVKSNMSCAIQCYIWVKIHAFKIYIINKI